MAEADENLRRCLKALRSAKSDNEKFAALMMVTKLCKPGDCDREARQQLLDAITLKFLSRLLRTRTVPEGCPETIYKTLALNILSSFCTDPEVAGRAEMKNLVPIFNELILHPPSAEEGEGDTGHQLEEDCYACLLAMTASTSGRTLLLEAKAVPALVQVVTAHGWGRQKALQVLLQMAPTQGLYMWALHSTAMNSLLADLTQEFCQVQDASKFELCNTLMNLFSSLPKDFLSPPYPRWMFDMMQALESIVKSKLGQAQRDPALRLLAAVVACLGMTPLLPPVVSDEKMMFLITHLACIEVRMTLENGTVEQIQAKTEVLYSCYVLLEAVINHMISGQMFRLEERQVVQLHAALRGAFSAILYLLSEVRSQNIPLSPTSTVVLMAVRALGVWLAEETTALHKEVLEILPFLLSLCQNQPNSNDEQLAALTITDVTEDVEEQPQPTLVGTDSAEPMTTEPAGDSCREEEGTGSTEDPAAGESQTGDSAQKDSASASSVDSSGAMECEPTETGLSPEEVAVNSASRVDQQLRKDMEFMGPYILRYLLPGLCHITAEEEGREIVVKENFPAFLVDYLESQVPGLINTDAALEDERDSLATACGVFLNFAVTEAELVASLPAFHRLLDILLPLLPQIVYQDSLLVLTANFTTLGLMLLRRQASRTDQDSEARRGFVSACVTFLSRAHYLKVQRGSYSLEMSDSYQAVWHSIEELWFLSLQSLTVSLTAVEEVAPAILKSGWLQTLVKILLQTKGKESLEDLQSNFLSLVCILASNNPTARGIVKDAQGLKLARMYDSKDLKKALQG